MLKNMNNARWKADSSAGPKKVENTSTFIIQVADHGFKLEQKIGTESPCAGSILFRSGPMSGNRP